MLTPRNYLSFSQMTLFEMSPEKYAEQYFYGKKQRISRNIRLGSDVADSLQNGEDTGDPLVDFVISRLPKFERMDLPVEDPTGVEVTFVRNKKEIKAFVPVLKDKKFSIPILALPDTAKADYTAFKEYKTSTRRWTQKMVDESGQISFYATAVWLAKKVVPEDIELVCAETAYNPDESLSPTGDIWRFPTKRTMVDVIKMTSRMKRAWAGIKELGDKTLF